MQDRFRNNEFMFTTVTHHVGLGIEVLEGLVVVSLGLGVIVLNPIFFNIIVYYH